MSKLWIITKNEFFRYFISPLAYVYLICFLLLNSSFAIYFGHFFDNGNADLQSMFSFQPWIYLLFLPGISMRLWAEEFRTKTILQIITMPVSVSNLVWGKFFASWLFCALALFLTFPFWITVNLLGSPDNSVIFISYIGSLLLAGCMLAISQTMSALTKNQVIALVFSVIANLLFFLSGIEYVLGFFRTFAPLTLIDMIASFSFLTHFSTISSGLFEARDFIFFGSLILLFNFTTVLIISFKTSGTTAWLKSRNKEYYILVFLLFLTAFAGINLLANSLLRRFQIDFTSEKLYTLTDSTYNVLQNLSEPVTAKLYYSPILGKKNPAFRIIFDNIRLLLHRYAAESNGKFSYQILNPEPFGNIEDRALNLGLQPFPIIEDNTNAYFGLTLTDAVENQKIIPFFSLERAHLLEQDLTTSLYLLNAKPKNLGILTSLPMFENVIKNVATQEWEIIRQLKQFYNLRKIDEKAPNFSGLDALLIAHPQKMTPELEQAIYQYSINGGKILALFDIAAEAPRIFSPATQTLQASDYGTLPQKWGFSFHPEYIVTDLENSSSIDAGTSQNPIFTQDVVQFYIRDKGFNRSLKETALLKEMLITSAGIFMPLKNANSYFIPLLQASDVSALMSSDIIYKGVHPLEILRAFKADANPKYIAARIIGKITQNPFDLIIVGDTDLLYDSFWTVKNNVLEKQYLIPLLDNGNFILNALDSLLGNDTLLSLRGKSASRRNFPDIEIQRKLNQQKFSIKEKAIFEEIEKSKLGLQEIWNKKDFEQRDTFTPDELALIANIRQTIDSLREDLYSIRKESIAYQQDIRRMIIFADIYLLPLLLLFGFGIFYIIKNYRNFRFQFHIDINRKLVWLALCACALLIFGVYAAQHEESQDTGNYIGKPFFSALPQQINNIQTITLKGYQKELKFVRENGIWKLKGYPHQPVYQERIRSFLSALLEARYYEKKSDKIEHLGKFNLTPIQAENSQAVRVELYNEKDKLVTSFDVGKYDIDLGRGSKGAYIKFDNLFQVWLVEIDLIDLSLTPENWTYSSLWNLRYGRFISVNGKHDVDMLADIAKTLLNAYFTETTISLSSPKFLGSLKIESEGNNQTQINFYQNENKYYLQYTFTSPITENSLKNFSEYARGIFYEISSADWEKIKDVITDD